MPVRLLHLHHTHNIHSVQMGQNVIVKWVAQRKRNVCQEEHEVVALHIWSHHNTF